MLVSSSNTFSRLGRAHEYLTPSHLREAHRDAMENLLPCGSLVLRHGALGAYAGARTGRCVALPLTAGLDAMLGVSGHNAAPAHPAGIWRAAGHILLETARASSILVAGAAVLVGLTVGGAVGLGISLGLQAYHARSELDWQTVRHLEYWAATTPRLKDAVAKRDFYLAHTLPIEMGRYLNAAERQTLRDVQARAAVIRARKPHKGKRDLPF